MQERRSITSNQKKKNNNYISAESISHATYNRPMLLTLLAAVVSSACVLTISRVSKACKYSISYCAILNTVVVLHVSKT